MTEHLRRKSEEHKVRHVFSGRNHFFEVQSEANIYNVRLSVGCDCKFMGVQGVANAKICSHIMAALKYVVEEGEMPDDEAVKRIEEEIKADNTTLLQEKRNECLRLVRPMNRRVGEIRYSEAEGQWHKKKKEEICYELREQKKEFVTEAIFETGGKADVLVLDDFEVIEIMSSEKDESIEKKRELYPKGLRIRTVKV